MRVRTLEAWPSLLEQRQHPGDGTDKSQLLGDELMAARCDPSACAVVCEVPLDCLGQPSCGALT